ncbi:MAG: hypothetical protein JSS61_04915 [Verrucomicrobia bacterium]|nr:hypothetical protein [Verrucomicrobiota bacterium]
MAMQLPDAASSLLKNPYLLLGGAGVTGAVCLMGIGTLASAFFGVSSLFAGRIIYDLTQDIPQLSNLPIASTTARVALAIIGGIVSVMAFKALVLMPFTFVLTMGITAAPVIAACELFEALQGSNWFRSTPSGA